MKVGETDSQLTLRFESGMTEAFATCREFVDDRAHHQGRQLKWIAAEMDLSPSALSRKLSQIDQSRLTLDDLERFIEVTGDTSPILYLVEKYLTDREAERLAELEAENAVLRRRLGMTAA